MRCSWPMTLTENYLGISSESIRYEESALLDQGVGSCLLLFMHFGLPTTRTACLAFSFFSRHICSSQGREFHRPGHCWRRPDLLRINHQQSVFPRRDCWSETRLVSIFSKPHVNFARQMRQDPWRSGTWQPLKDSHHLFAPLLVS